MAFMEATLFDLESAKFSSLSVPVKEWMMEGRFNVSPVFGWLVCINVNAKNRLGGYVGWSTEYFLMRGNRIVVYRNNPYRFKVYPTTQTPVKCRYS